MTAPIQANFATLIKRAPLIAILRGISPDEVVPIGTALYDAGFRVIEVPLNSPEPFESISRLAKHFASAPDVLVGAGTVMTEADVRRVSDAGGRLIVMPHSDFEVIFAARKAGLWVTPGIATPTEAIASLGAGADGLKLFPAEMISPVVVKALRAVLPADTVLIPVGGITPANIPLYRAAGATAFGIGSALYSRGRSAAEVHTAARAFVAALQA